MARAGLNDVKDARDFGLAHSNPGHHRPKFPECDGRSDGTPLSAAFREGISGLSLRICLSADLPSGVV